MNLKKNIVLMSALVLVIVFTTAMISRSTETVNTESSKKSVVKAKFDRKSLSERGRKLVHETLLKPLSRKYKVNLKRQMVSRCPSGLRYYVQEGPSEANPYFAGKMRLYSGCRGKIVCEFRVAASEDRIEIFQADQKKYVTVSNWMLASAPASQQAQKN